MRLRTRILPAALAAATLLAACQPTPDAGKTADTATRPYGRIAFKPCVITNEQGLPPEEAQCASFPVAENPAQPDGRKIALNIAWLLQTVSLLGMVAYINGPNHLVYVQLTIVAWLISSTVVAQLIAWCVEWVRRRRHGILVVRACTVLLGIAYALRPDSKAIAAGALGWGVLNLVIGGIVTVLPLPILPFAPEQSLSHYAAHVVYALGQVPLVILSSRALRGDVAATSRG